jgi:hypothetical protein
VVFLTQNTTPASSSMLDYFFSIYVDDTIFAGPNTDQISREIEGLGVSKYETQHKFQLCEEGEVRDLLGIRIEKEGDGTFQLTQTGLIDNVLKAAGLEDCKRCVATACATPIGSVTEKRSWRTGNMPSLWAC